MEKFKNCGKNMIGSEISWKLVLVVSVWVFGCTGFAKGQQDYVFTAPADGQYYQPNPQDFINPSDIIPFRQTPVGFQPTNFQGIDPYGFQRDLQTSDLPLHLQQSLPQYRHTNTNQNNRLQAQNRVVNTPVGFRPSAGSLNQPQPYVSASTHRPNYSHLFPQSHHVHDPSQTETFLGQVTLNDPLQAPPQQERQYDSFTAGNHQKTQEITSNAFVGTNSNKLNGKPNFLNHRTRVFVPTGSQETSSNTQSKNYFVNTNGDVYITTKTPFSPKPTSPVTQRTTLERRNPFSPTTRAPSRGSSSNLRQNKTSFLPKKNTLDLESLLEEPIQENEEANDNKNNVEVIQESTTSSKPKGESSEEEGLVGYSPSPLVMTTVETPVASGGSVEVTTDYEYENEEQNEANEPSKELSSHSDEYAEEDKSGHSSEDNDIQNNDYLEHDYEDESDNNKTENSKEPSPSPQNISSSYEVLTTKPQVEPSNFQQFVDTSDLEIITEEPQTTVVAPQNVPIGISMSSNVHAKKGQKNPKVMVDSKEMEYGENNVSENDEKKPELVVSVVTSKTVVNNTVTAPSTSLNTEVVSSAPSTMSTIVVNDDNTTESWIVVASVQTSRSVSGARYLPSSIVSQEERLKLLNENSEEAENENSSKEQTDETSKEKEILSSDKIRDENTSAEESTENDKETEQEHTTEETLSTLIPSVSNNGNGGNPVKTSTESLIDKLDMAQSELSSGLLSGGFKNGGKNIAVIKENMSDKADMTTMVDMNTGSSSTTTTTSKPAYPQVHIRKYSPGNRASSTKKPKRVFENIKQDDLTGLLPAGFKPKYQNNRKSAGTTSTTTEKSAKNVDVELPQGDEPDKTIETLIGKSKIVLKDDISSLLPPGYQPEKIEKPSSSKLLEEIISKAKPKNTNSTQKYPSIATVDDVAAFLPPGYKPPGEKEEKEPKIEVAKQDDISKFLPPGYKLPKTSTPKPKGVDNIINKAKPVDDISSLLPPGYKAPKSSGGNAPKGVDSLLKEAKPVDISAFLPPGYKPRTYTTKKPKSTTPRSTTKESDDISSIPANLLPKGYKPGGKPSAPKGTTTTEEPIDLSNIPANLLPPGYKEKLLKKDTVSNSESSNADSNKSTENSASPASSTTTAKPSGVSEFKVKFPTRPGGGVRKSRLTTPRSSGGGGDEVRVTNGPTAPTIHKGWPSRATTEFTGWPTPSTTPISIEKLLEAARTASMSTSTTEPTTVAATTTTTTTTTTTQRPTTPGICIDECDIAGTIKLVGGAKWVPELLDRNTKEWQILANEVQVQLDNVYSNSPTLNKWYKKIRIDGFSEGSVFVDYIVELNDLGRQVDTQEIKKIFHESLTETSMMKQQTSSNNGNREGKSLNETLKMEGKLSLGNFVVDPKFTDFLVLPKQAYPTVGYAEDNVLLPQWAIAVIVIGLASLLFVIIFGVTVLVNRQKNAKKKTPSPLTEDMLNELNKNHMGGFDNYGQEDLYNMEDVWNERGYNEQKPPPKKRSNASLHDNSTSNLYDSWRSEWNGYYYNAYYGNNPGTSQHSGYSGRRRSDYDTNF